MPFASILDQLQDLTSLGFFLLAFAALFGVLKALERSMRRPERPS